MNIDKKKKTNHLNSKSLKSFKMGTLILLFSFDP